MATRPDEILNSAARNDAGPYHWPDQRGHFGPYGGMFVAETLMQPLTSCARPMSAT